MIARIPCQILARVVKILQENMTAGISSARITLFLQEHKNLARISYTDSCKTSYLNLIIYTLERIIIYFGENDLRIYDDYICHTEESSGLVASYPWSQVTSSSCRVQRYPSNVQHVTAIHFTGSFSTGI